MNIVKKKTLCSHVGFPYGDDNDNLNDGNDDEDDEDVGNDDNDDCKNGDLIVTKRKSIGRPLHLPGQTADRAPEHFIPDCSIYDITYILYVVFMFMFFVYVYVWYFDSSMWQWFSQIT